MSTRIVCFGPGPKFKGGISNYNTSLARSLDALEGTEVHIVSWTQQYPAIIPREFLDKKSRTDLLEGTEVKVAYLTNYNNPFTWAQTYRYIIGLKPDIVIFQWAIAIQGLPLGRIARRLKKHKSIEVIFDLHFVVQKENSSIDRLFTRYGIKTANTYIAHAYKTVRELQALYADRAFDVNETGDRSDGKTTVIKLYHPVYDIFQPRADFDKSAFKKEHGLRDHVFLFFGFIRKYKGLHNALKAFAELASKRDDVSLIVCGESFWQTLDNTKWSARVKQFLFGIAKSIFLRKTDDEREYKPLALIDELDIGDRCLVVNEFVPNEDVHKYFQASDAVLLFYLTATPSGVESIGYNFEMPILATEVGHFPETVKPGYNGYLAKDRDTHDMSRIMLQFIEQPIDRKNVAKTAEGMSWENYSRAILKGRL